MRSSCRCRTTCGRCRSIARCCSRSDATMSSTRAEVSIRDATNADLPEMAAILNHEIAASPFVYAEEPVTLDERRAWLDEHRSSGLPILVATDGADRALLGWPARRRAHGILRERR